MRVLHVVDGHLPDLDTWAAHRACRVASSQLDLGFEPKVLALAESRSPAMAGPADPLQDVPVERLAFVPDPGPDQASWRERALFFHRTSRRVRRIVSRDRMHLVHVYGRPTVALASLLGAHQAEVPVVYEPSAHSFQGDPLPTWALSSFDVVVTPSRARADEWAERLGRRARIQYVPDGIDVERLRDVQPGPPDPTFVVAPILDGRPNLDWLQAALSRRPELQRRVKLFVAFSDDRDRVRFDWGLSAERVHRFAPTLDALGDALNQSTALLYLADAPLGTPLEVLEAAARGRTIVAPACPAQAELVRDGDSGRLVPDRDERELAQALTDLAGRAGPLGAALRRDAIRSRSWDVIVESYFEIYDRARRHGPSGGTLQRLIRRVENRWMRRRTRARA